MIDMSLDTINFRIQCLENRAERISKIQDEWITKHGYENSSLADTYNELYDEISELCAQR